MYKQQQQQQQRQLQQQVQCNLTCRHSRALPRTAPPPTPPGTPTLSSQRDHQREQGIERGREGKRAHVSRGGEAAQQRDVGIDAARTPQIATWKLVYVSFAAAKWATTTSKVGHKGLPPTLPSLCLPLSRHVSHST